MVLLPILQGSDTILFFEYVLKVGLTGKTQQAADLGERFCRVGQQAFGLLQLAAGSSQNLKPDLVMEAFCRYLGVSCDDTAFGYHRLEMYADAGEDGRRELVTLESLGWDME